MKRVSFAFFALAALVLSAYAATVPPLLPRGVAPSDRLPVINTGTTNAYTVSPDQLSSYVQGQLSTASAARRGLVRGGGVGIAIRPDGTIDATGAAIAEGVIAFENLSTAIKGRYQWIGADAAGSAAAAVTGHESLYNHDNLPTAMQRSALLGSYGTPGSSNRYVTDTDPRNADARTPKTHAASHGAAGTDPVIISSSQVTGLDAALAGKQAALGNAATLGGIGEAGGLPLWKGGAWPGGGGQTGGDMYKATYDPANHAADAFSRANHTGTQPANTVTGLAASATTDTTTTANIADSANKRFVTDAQRTVLASTSGTNTGDENQATIKTKLGAATDVVDGYLSAADHLKFNAKQNALTAGVDYLAPNGSAASLTGFPTLNQNTTGNAATATKLATARNINGVPFDGTGNISISSPWSSITGTPTTLAGYGISDAYTRAYLDSALAGKLSDAPSDGNSYARKNGAWSPFVGGVQPFANISTALRTNGIFTPSVTSVAQDGTHGIWMKNTVPYTGARTGGAIFHNMTTMNYCETDNNCKRFGSGNSSGGITALTGDVTASGTGSVAATLANSGATAGTYTNATVTVNAKGVVTSASSGATPIGGTVGSTADHFPVSSGTGGSTLKASGAWIDPVTGMFHTPEQSGIREVLGMGDGSLAHWAGWTLAGTLSGDYYLALPTSAPYAGQTMVTGTPATVTVDGVASTVVPVTFVTNTVSSGTYTPTATVGVNSSGVTAYLAHWTRIGNEVSVWGHVDATTTTGNTLSSVFLTLPVASTYTNGYDLQGLMSGYIGAHTGIVQGDTSTYTRAQLVWYDTVSGSSTMWKYTFTYTVK